jgi:aspartate--ammonia ligase
MFFLNKAHIGEVQASVWSNKNIRENAEKGINLL